MWSRQDEFQPGTIANVCFTCKSDLRPYTDGRKGHEPAVDTGVMVEFEGYVAFCETCIVEAGALVGLITEAQADDLRLDASAAEAEAENLRRDLDLTLAALDSLRSLPASAARKTDPEPEAEPEPETKP